MFFSRSCALGAKASTTIMSLRSMQQITDVIGPYLVVGLALQPTHSIGSVKFWELSGRGPIIFPGF